jgi:hypothetical protein
MNGELCSLGRHCRSTTGTSGLTFLPIDAKGPDSAARTCKESRLRIPFFFAAGTRLLAT